MTQKSSGILKKTFYVSFFFSYTRQSSNISSFFLRFEFKHFLFSTDNQNFENFQLKSRFSSLLQQNTHSVDSIFHVTPTTATWWTWGLQKSESRLTQITAAADTTWKKVEKKKMGFFFKLRGINKPSWEIHTTISYARFQQSIVI